MPNPAENLIIAQKVLKEVKSLSISTNDIIPKVQLPVMLRDSLEHYRKQFGENKINRYLAYISKMGQLRDKTYELAVSHKATSPLMVARIATALHGVGECLESSALAAFKLLEKRQTCFMVYYKGKPNIYRGFKPFDHTIVLLGNVDIRYLSKMSDFVNQPDDVMVVDAFIGYAGPAKNYIADNFSYIDEFKFEHALTSSYNFFGEEEFAMIPTLLTSAKTVGKALSKQGITVYERHPDDMPAILKVAERAVLSTYPAKLFDIKHSQEQTKRYETAVTFMHEDECGVMVSKVLPSVSQLIKTVDQFFKEPLPAYHFKDEEIPTYTPKPL